MPFLVTSPDIDWDRVTDWLLTHGLRILLILALALVADLALRVLVPRVIRPTVARQMRGKPDEEIEQRSHTLVAVLRGSGRFVLVVWALFTILPELGVNITPMLASVGIAGIALGFGAQSLVKDILTGLFILIENQYSKGDVVTVAGISGQVEEVGLRRTVLRDLDGVVHHVPNSQIAVASNLTQEWSRVNLNVSVAYGEDLDRVFEVINRVGRELAADAEFGPLILKAPQVLRVEAFGESGIAIKVLGDTEPIRQWEVMGELRKRLIRAFLEEGIHVPFPPHVVAAAG
ncbi:MAG: mechanosensitive ion channel family protein [Dehalococcoidia bacterium]|nr:mechanosensitive ion channel family protein [Dehalococcoidia bacterium]